ncbi:MAG: GNAT family N-acetyltransferase [Lachnospiraceae bacterium]|nr:GNAT family N-acetyltransferase [Lachnospiraceae bacterium]
MNHKGTILLETNRLILRKFVIEDSEAMYNNWASEDEVTKFLTWPTHSDVEVTRAVLSNWIADYNKADFYNWAIELKEIGEVIGNISVVLVKENIECAELGYCMGTNWWGLGIMPEAGKVVVKYLFEEVGFNRIAATHDKNNPKSGRVMQKIGMTYEGILRKAGFCNQGVIDEVWYSILRDEYQNKN